MVFLWCGLHLADEERCQNPFACPALHPCKTIACELFLKESPFCIHMVTGTTVKLRDSHHGKRRPAERGIRKRAGPVRSVGGSGGDPPDNAWHRFPVFAGILYQTIHFSRFLQCFGLADLPESAGV